MKKGFTLVELLAVIVILAIIALIATPIVINVISQAQEGARLRSVEGYAKALETAHYVSIMNGDGSDVNSLVPEYSGATVECAEKTISNNKIVLKNCKVGNDENLYDYANGKSIKVGSDSSEETTGGPTITLGLITVTSDTIVIPYSITSENGLDTIICVYGTNQDYGNEGTIENGNCVIHNLSDNTEYYYKLTNINTTGMSSDVTGKITTKDQLQNKTYKSGDSIKLGGYNWHVIGDDGKNVTLLMDEGQLVDMAHCTNDKDNSTDCAEYPAGTVLYSWDKSLIRSYLNGEFLKNLENKIQNPIIGTDICKESSKEGRNYFSYGGFLKSELQSLGESCSDGYVNDKVRLITMSEYYNISPYFSDVELPFTGVLGNGVNNGKIAKIDSINRITDATWLYSSSKWWTMHADSIGDVCPTCNTSSNAGHARVIYGTQNTIPGTVASINSVENLGLRPVITISKDNL